MSGHYPTGESYAAENFRAELHRLGLSWTEAARLLGTDEKQIRRWVGGEHQPLLSTLQRWAKLTGRSPVWFLEPHDDRETNGDTDPVAA